MRIEQIQPESAAKKKKFLIFLFFFRIFGARSSTSISKLWQAVNDQLFIQMIYSEDRLIDCEYLRVDSEPVTSFMDTFRADFHLIQDHNDQAIGANVLIVQRLHRMADVPTELRELMEMSKLKEQCDRLHRQIKAMMHVDQDHVR